jgi:hypothetical protein
VGDPLRSWRLLQRGTSVWWQVQSRNKRSLALDLRAAEGQDIARRLIAEADVLIENFRPGTLEGWGMAPGCTRSTPSSSSCASRAMARAGRTATCRALAWWARPWAACAT